MSKSKEKFVPVKDYEGYYEISNLGRIKSLTRKVKRSDGIWRRVNEKFLVASGKEYKIMLAKNGIHKNEPYSCLLVKSHFKDYNKSKHHIIRNENLPNILGYTFVTKHKKNQMKILHSDGKTITTYDNYHVFCDDNNIAYGTFLKAFFSNNIKTKLISLRGCVVSFKNPLYHREQMKILNKFDNFETRSEMIDRQRK